MQAYRIIILTACMALMYGCAAPYDVQYNYDTGTDFSTIKTYGWMRTTKNADKYLSVIRNVREAVDAELRAKGYQLADDSPDFLIAQHFSIKDKVVQGDEYGYLYGQSGVYVDKFDNQFNPDTYQYEEESIVLDFVHAQSKKLIWRGSAKADAEYIDSQEESEQLIYKIVKDILKNFPPPSN